MMETSHAFAVMASHLSRQAVLVLALLGATKCSADEILFQDKFEGKLGQGWSWVREHPESWRVTPRALEIQPPTMRRSRPA